MFLIRAILFVIRMALFFGALIGVGAACAIWQQDHLLAVKIAGFGVMFMVASMGARVIGLGARKIQLRGYQ